MPEAVTEQGDGRGAEAIVVRIEVAAKSRMEAEGWEKCRGDHEAVDALGLAGAGEVVILMTVHGDGGEAFGLALPVEEVEIVDGRLVLAGVFPVDGDELAGVRVRQRIQEHAVDDGEERGVGADAERQGEDGDDAKRRRLEEHAEGEAKVLKQGDHVFLGEGLECYGLFAPEFRTGCI